MTDYNPNRIARLKELTVDCQGIINESKTLYTSFLADVASLDQKLQAVYAHANLQPPKNASYTILQGNSVFNKVADDQKEVHVATIVIDMVGAASMSELAPAATACLVDAGILTEAEASVGIMSVLGTDITVGGAVGGILGALAAALVGGAVATSVSVFSHQSDHRALTGGIVATKRTRLRAEISRQRLHCIQDVVEATSSTCDTLMSMDLLDDASIQALIKKDAQPAVKRLNKTGKKSGIRELYTLDIGRNSWMQDG